MMEKEIIIKYEEFEDGEKLDKNDSLLVEKAEDAIVGSYAPYSEFHVGAALMLENGDVIMGSNQENAAYPSGLCAERVALFYAKSQYPNEIITSIAIAAKADNFINNEIITPCGSCRQVMAETEKRQKSKIRIIMKGNMAGTRIVNGVENLLPMMFHEVNLKKNK